MNAGTATAPWSPWVPLRTATVPTLDLLVADDQHVGHLLELGPRGS